MRSNLKKRNVVLYGALGAIVFMIAAALPAGGAGTEPPSPLAEYRGFGHDPAADEQQFAADELQREELIATCMAAHGYDYWASPSILVDDSMTAADLWNAARNRPNEKYVTSLTATEKEGYFVALYGIVDPYSEDGDDLVDPSTGTGSGCTREAFRAVPGVFAAKITLRAEYDAMKQQVADSAVVRSAEEAWAACMSQRGHAYTTVSDIYASMEEEAIALTSEGETLKADLALLDRRLEEALEAGRVCDEEASLSQTRHEERVRHESEFVLQYRHVLDEFSGP